MKPERRQKQILVVDNHPLMLTYMRRLLEKRGDEVLTAEDGLAALKILAEHRPDVVFVDQVMPNISGEKLCRIIRSRPALKDTCVIVLSAIAAEADFDFIEFGANYCIAKGPFDKMSTHILALLYRFDADGRCGQSNRIIGREDVYYRQISKELLYSKKHGEVILHNLAEGVLELTLGGEIVYANPTALRMLGSVEEEVLGNRFQALFGGTTRARIDAVMAEATADRPACPHEATVEIQERQIRLNLIRIEDPDHQAVTVIMDDVTRVLLLQEGLIRSERLAATGQLAACIAHEINSPLQAIYSILNAMGKQYGSDPALGSDLEVVRGAFDSIRATINNLLDLNRPGEEGRQKTSVNRIVEKAVALVQQHMKAAKVDLSLSLSDDVPEIIVSPRQLSQVLLNLINNAVEALCRVSDAKSGRRRRTVDRGRLEIRTDRQDGFVRIRFEDNGPGIAEGDLNRIFDPFYTRKKKMGIGVGLSICHRIVEEHGGRIFAENRPAGGARMTVLLPAS